MVQQSTVATAAAAAAKQLFMRHGPQKREKSRCWQPDQQASQIGSVFKRDPPRSCCGGRLDLAFSFPKQALLFRSDTDSLIRTCFVIVYETRTCMKFSFDQCFSTPSFFNVSASAGTKVVFGDDGDIAVSIPLGRNPSAALSPTASHHQPVPATAAASTAGNTSLHPAGGCAAGARAALGLRPPGVASSRLPGLSGAGAARNAPSRGGAVRDAPAGRPLAHASSAAKSDRLRRPAAAVQPRREPRQAGLPRTAVATPSATARRLALAKNHPSWEAKAKLRLQMSALPKPQGVKTVFDD